MEATTKKTTKVNAAVAEEKKTGTEKPRYNKTWEAVIKYRGRAKVNDPTLFYR